LYIRQDFLNSRAWFLRSWIWRFHGHLVQFISDSSNTRLFGSKIIGPVTRLCIFHIQVKSPSYTMLLWLYRLSCSYNYSCHLSMMYGKQLNLEIQDKCCNHNPVLSWLMTYRHVCKTRNKMDTTSGAGKAYPSGSPEFNPVVLDGLDILNL
jgi:hypothetical protein